MFIGYTIKYEYGSDIALPISEPIFHDIFRIWIRMRIGAKKMIPRADFFRIRHQIGRELSALFSPLVPVRGEEKVVDLVVWPSRITRRRCSEKKGKEEEHVGLGHGWVPTGFGGGDAHRGWWGGGGAPARRGSWLNKAYHVGCQLIDKTTFRLS